MHQNQDFNSINQNQIADLRNFNELFIKQQETILNDESESNNKNKGIQIPSIYINEENIDEHNYVNMTSTPSTSNNSSLLVLNNFSNNSSIDSGMKQGQQNIQLQTDERLLAATLPMLNQRFLQSVDANMSTDSDTVTKLKNFNENQMISYENGFKLDLNTADSSFFNENPHSQSCSSFSNKMPNLPISLTYRQTIGALPTTTPTSISALSYNRSFAAQSDHVNSSSSCPSVSPQAHQHSVNSQFLPMNFASQDQTEYFTQIVPNTPKEIKDYYLR